MAKDLQTAKKKTAKKKTAKKEQAGTADPNQTHFKGFEPIRIKPIDKNLKEFAELLALVKDSTAKMKEIQETVRELLAEHSLLSYRYANVSVEIESEAKAKIRMIKGADPAPSSETEGDG